MRQADRAERHWLAMSVAMLWILTIGGEQEISESEPLVSERTFISAPNLSCFVNGLLTTIAQLLNGQPISFGRLFPLPFNYYSDLHFADSS